MNKKHNIINSFGLKVPSILLPKNEFLQKWPVIACDQFTQDRDYWERAKTIADGAPSTLNLIFPEVFLNDADTHSYDASQRIADIHSTMNRYLQSGVFAQPKQGFIYIERDTPYQKKRRGLVAAIDLEQYDWHPETRPLIRCTEDTVPERLPPRMDIRRGAPLELPHVLLLIDDGMDSDGIDTDETDSLLAGIGERVKNTEPVYSTPLMMDSGHVTGWFLDMENESESNLSFIADKLDKLYRRSSTRYDKTASAGGEPFLFAVGDGNHSLAAAKGIWEEYKIKSRAENREYLSHPCRYALVEIENIYDPAIQFEPIHRLVFDIGFDETVSLLSKLPDFSCRSVNNMEELSKAVSDCRFCGQPLVGNRLGIISQNRYALIETSAAGIATACLQPLLDKYAEANPNLIDYIHDEAELFRLSAGGQMAASERLAAGILLPPVKKSGLFETVARLGPLPRKSFSMGHSSEKRFYLECRELKP